MSDKEQEEFFTKVVLKCPWRQQLSDNAICEVKGLQCVKSNCAVFTMIADYLALERKCQ